MMITHGRQEFIPADSTALGRLADLADALLYEAGVIEELRQALLSQRAGVAADDPDLVESSIHAMSRTLLTLDEAKRRRSALTALIAGGDPTPIERLEHLLGGVLPREVEEARAMVKHSALLAAQDVAINQHILRRAMEAGDVFLQRLFAMAGGPAAGYQRGERPTESAPQSGLILNRTA
jgi:hypothetical protein